MEKTQTNAKPNYLRFADLKRDYSLPQSTVYHLIKAQGFPKQIKLSKQTTVFKREEVEAWFAKREAMREGGGIMKALTLAFNNNPIHISRDAWFNATDMAKAFNKRPAEWLRLPETEKYIDALCRKSKVGKSHFVKTRKGGSVATRGTWFHRKLAVRFAQWLSVDFSIWCDEVVEERISGGWQQERDASKAYYRMMTDTLQQSRLDQGKDTKVHHFTNEARLINYALTGDYNGINRDNADKRTLSAIKALESYNSVLIMQGLPYDERKAKLCEYAIKYRTPLIEVAL